MRNRCEDKEVEGKRSGQKEGNHIKEVDQKTETMIIEGSRQGEKSWGKARYRYTVESINSDDDMEYKECRLAINQDRGA